MTRWLRKHPIPGFLLLTFAVSYLIGAPLLMAYLAWAPSQPTILRTYFSRVLVVYGPGFAALFMTFACDGRGGVVLLLKRLIPHVSDLPWGLLIFLVGFGSAACALKSAGASTAQFTEAIGSAGGVLIGHFVLQILIIAVGEELGWRGWLLPRLLERVSRLRAALIVGAAWGGVAWPASLFQRAWRRSLSLFGAWLVVRLHLDLVAQERTPFPHRRGSCGGEHALVFLGAPGHATRLGPWRGAFRVARAGMDVCPGRMRARAVDQTLVAPT